MAGYNETQKFYQPKFTTEMQLLAQQTEKIIRPWVTVGNYQGESAEIIKQIGVIEAAYGDETGINTPDVDVPKDQRWCYPQTSDVGKLFKRADMKRILADPAAQERMAFTAAMNRAEDKKCILPAFFGNSNTGKNGQTVTAFPNDGSQDVARVVGSSDGATNTGMNTAKLIAGRKIFRKNNVTFGQDNPLVVLLSADDEAYMLNDIKATQSFYNGGDPVLKNGTLSYWMGFNFVFIDETVINPADATERWVPMWVKDGMHLGLWEDLQAWTAPDPGKKFNEWLYMEQMKGASRTQEKKVVRVKCSVG